MRIVAVVVALAVASGCGVVGSPDSGVGEDAASPPVDAWVDPCDPREISRQVQLACRDCCGEGNAMSCVYWPDPLACWYCTEGERDARMRHCPGRDR